MPTWRCEDAAATAAVGRAIGAAAAPGGAIALDGDLGAGKTVFTQGLARGLGIAGPIPSPTYAIVHIHEGPIALWHADLYRVARAEDLGPLTLDEAAAQGAVLVVEWASRFPEALPEDHLTVGIAIGEDGIRTLTLHAHGPTSAAWLQRVPHAP